MKRNLFLLGLAVAAMTSCTNDEVLEQAQPTQKAIGFESFVNKTTRANGVIGSVDKENLKNFWVFANYGTVANSYTDLYDEPEKIYWDETNEVWKSTTTKYWTNNTYNFVAYADENTSTSAPGYVDITTGGALQISNYVLDYTLRDAANNNVLLTPTVSNQKDIIADVVTIQGEMNVAKTVGFTFNHLLSKVKFTVINNSNYPMSISALKINGINIKGSITMNATTDLSVGPTWTLPAESSREIIDIYPIAASSTNIASAGQVASFEFLVLPQELTGVTAEISADFYDPNSLSDVIDQKIFTTTGEGALSLNLNEYPNWKPGYFYNYIISLPAAGKEIKFDVTDVEDWTPAAGTTTSGSETIITPIELNPNSSGN